MGRPGSYLEAMQRQKCGEKRRMKNWSSRPGSCHHSPSEKGTLIQRDTVGSRCLWQKQHKSTLEWESFEKILISSHLLTCNRINHKYTFSRMHMLVHLTSILPKCLLLLTEGVFTVALHFSPPQTDTSSKFSSCTERSCPNWQARALLLQI